MDVRDMIVDDGERGIFRYHRSTMTSPGILEAERERIFDRCWLYLGHESEVEAPGDYRRRTVAGRPLFFARGMKGQVRVFLNTCPHRGALICRQDEGNAKVFQCFYHAWTFGVDGELAGVPDRAGYSDQFDRADLGLASPPKVDSYRGFYFVSFDPHAEDLSSYLAGAKEYLDLIADQSEVGMKVSRGSHRYSMQANWKLLSENGIDGYHLLPLHRTYFAYVYNLARELPAVNLLENWEPGPVLPLGNGHVMGESHGSTGRAVAYWHPLLGEDTREEIERTRERLVERFGKERAHRIADYNRFLLIYPNLFIYDFLYTTIRVHWPTAPDESELIGWSLVPSEHSSRLLGRRLDNMLTLAGPGGFAIPDDIEAVESCQAGIQAGGVEWSDASRGMHRQALTSDELQARTFWRQWHGHLMGMDKVETADRIPARRDG